MKREAESHAAEDKKRREVIDLKNQGENLAYTTEKTLKEYGEKVSADVRGNIESALNNLRDALKSEDGDRIKKSMETLAAASWLHLKRSFKGTKTDQAAEVGKLLAANAQKAGIEVVVFDRGGYLFHGRVKALADAAREGGLRF